MPAPRLEQIERIAYEGPLSPTAAIVLGVLFAAGTVLLLWREREALGRWMPVAAALRIAAAAVVLWMLTGPTRELVERLSVPRTVVVATDRSGSMATVDRPSAAADARWAAVTGDQMQSAALVAADRARIAVQTAWRTASDARRELAEHAPLARLSDSLAECQIALDRAAKHAASLSRAAADDDTLSERAERLIELLEQGVDAAHRAASEEVDAGDAANLPVLEAAIERLASTLADANRRITILAFDVAEAATPSADSIESSRADRVRSALQTLESQAITDLDEQVAIQRLLFAEEVTPVAAFADPATPSTTGEDAADAVEGATEYVSASTDLTAVIAQLARLRSQQSLALSIVYTDGQHTDLQSRSPQEVASESSAGPVYFVPAGTSLPLRDVSIHRIDAPTTVVRGDDAQIDVIVTAIDCAGESTGILLRQAGRVIDEQPLEFAGQHVDRRVTFRVPTDQIGWQEFEVEVTPLAEEASEGNNLAAASLEVVRDQLVVLLADGMPRWEFRYLQQLFRRDERIVCDELVFSPQVKGSGALATAPAMPTDPELLARYDAILLGDLSPQMLPPAALAALDDYVRVRGGNVVVVAGGSHMPQAFSDPKLLDLLPVERGRATPSTSGFALIPTQEARFHNSVLIAETLEASRAAWQALCRHTPVYGLSDYHRPRATARTVIEAVELGRSASPANDPMRTPERAFMAWHQLGGGRVVYLAAPQTYLLRFRAGDRRHHLFWGQLLQWLTTPQLGTGAEMVRLATDEVRYELGETVEATLWLKDPAGRPVADAEVQLSAESRDGHRLRVPLRADASVPGRYTAAVEGLHAGAYELRPQGEVVDRLLAQSTDGTHEVRALLSVHPTAGLEMSNTNVNLALLEQLAEATGGQVIPPTAVDEVLRLATLTPMVNESVERTPIWNRWWALVLALGCLTGEWSLRKWSGLI